MKLQEIDFKKYRDKNSLLFSFFLFVRKVCLCTNYLLLNQQLFFYTLWSNDSHLSWMETVYLKILNSPPPPLSCRTSPACSTPSMRWWTPPSTIPPAAARRCGSSSRWLPTPASGGGAARRVRQVKLTLTQWVGGGGAERASWGPPCVACCQLTQRCACCHAERRLLQACQSFVPRSLGVAPSLPLNGVHF